MIRRLTPLFLAAGLPIAALCAAPAFAAEITGERIFDRGSPRVDKVDKALQAAETAADVELRQAQVRHLRSRIGAWTRAAESLAAEEAAALREKDGAGAAAVAARRKAVLAKLETLKGKLTEETGETKFAPVPANPAKPADKPAPPVAAEQPKASVPALPEAPAAAAVVPPADVAGMMLGRWKVVENGRITGFIRFTSTGQTKAYNSYYQDGSPHPVGGAWRVSSEGEVTLVGDRANGLEITRLMAASRTKVEGARWSRKDEGSTFRKGGALELVKENP